MIQDKISQKQVLDNMSKLPWGVGESFENEHGVSCVAIDAAKEHMVTGIITVNGVTDLIEPYSGSCDLIATLSAVNNTYGKGLNPLSYELCVGVLDMLERRPEMFEDKGWLLENIKEALKKARI